ncbi:MAG: hypothetical protein DMF84_01220 [Acidobacteria bacterium]|nr:MAG: hypothetical protein DMF84_01220 [Acidobacteriota bacterium]
MRLLYLTPRFPSPTLKGDQLVAYRRLRVLGRRHEISLVSFVERDEELSRLDEVRECCVSVDVVRLPRWRALGRVAGRGLVSGAPLQILYYQSAKFEQRVRDLAQERSFDVAHAFMLRMAPYLRLVSTRSVLDAMDSMQLRMQRNVAVERAPRRWLFREELRRVTPYERKVGPSLDALIVLSDLDAEFFPGAASTAVANGVDTEIFAPDPALREPNTIVFSGIMSYPPNVAAARWFAERCFPAVRETVPSARLLLAGSSPPADLFQLGRRDDITVTGLVESMPATLNRASVAVAPMLSGAGMQNKVLEAMACGLAVVTTPLGLGSIRAEPGHDLVVAEGAETFAAAVVELLRDPARAQELGERARACVIERHSWEQAASDVEAIYERILSRRPSEAAI